MAKIVYERRPCTRCGGCGQHSYNPRHGSVCYGCSGSGKMLTRTARKTKQAIADYREQNCRVPAGTLKAGMIASLPGAAMLSPDRFRRIADVGPSNSASIRPDGTKRYMVEIRAVGKGNAALHCLPESLIRVPATEAQQAEMIAIARKMGGCEVVE